MRGPPVPSVVRGVAHISCDDPDPFSVVRGTDNRAAWKYERPCGVVLICQVIKYLIEAKGKMPINIFENCKSGSFVCNDFRDVRIDVA